MRRGPSLPTSTIAWNRIQEDTAGFARHDRGGLASGDDEEFLFGKAAPLERPPATAIAAAAPLRSQGVGYAIPLPQFGSAAPLVQEPSFASMAIA